MSTEYRLTWGSHAYLVKMSNNERTINNSLFGSYVYLLLTAEKSKSAADYDILQFSGWFAFIS